MAKKDRAKDDTNNEADHDDVKTLEYDEIIDGIFIGTNMCCETHFEDELLEKGIRADISFESERIDAPFGVPFYVWLPVKDKTPPSIEQMWFGVNCLKIWVDMGVKVYAHCKHGHGRAPTMITAYIMHTRNWDAEKAISYVEERRRGMHLEPSQIAALRAYGASHMKPEK